MILVSGMPFRGSAAAVNREQRNTSKPLLAQISALANGDKNYEGIKKKAKRDRSCLCDHLCQTSELPLAVPYVDKFSEPLFDITSKSARSNLGEPS